MKVAEFVKTTTLEWEGMISSVIVISEQGDEIETATGYLAERKGMIDGVIIDSVESSSPKELISLLKDLRSSGLRIRIVTDGKAPDVLDDLIGACYVDSVMVRLDGGIDANMERTLSLLSDYGIDCEYRTVLNSRNVTKEDIVMYAKAIKGARRYVLIQSKKDPFKKKDALEAAEAAKRYVKNAVIRQ